MCFISYPPYFQRAIKLYYIQDATAKCSKPKNVYERSEKFMNGKFRIVY